MQNSVMGSGKVARVRHQFDASPELVFDAWFDPNMLAVWMFDPNYRRQKAISLEADPVEGGTFRFEVEREGRTIVYLGEYLTIARPAFLQMTWKVEGYDRETLVTVDIEPKDGGCVLHLEHQLGEVSDQLVEEVESDWSADFRALASRMH